MGFESLVSQPSTSTWKPKTITIVNQYCAVVKMPVRNTNSSRATVASTAITVNTVYSGIGGLPSSLPTPHPREDLADGFVREQPADRYDDEEHQLLHRHREDQLDPGHVRGVVVPVLSFVAGYVPHR